MKHHRRRWFKGAFALMHTDCVPTDLVSTDFSRHPYSQAVKDITITPILTITTRQDEVACRNCGDSAGEDSLRSQRMRGRCR